MRISTTEVSCLGDKRSTTLGHMPYKANYTLIGEGNSKVEVHLKKQEFWISKLNESCKYQILPQAREKKKQKSVRPQVNWRDYGGICEAWKHCVEMSGFDGWAS